MCQSKQKLAAEIYSPNKIDGEEVGLCEHFLQSSSMTRQLVVVSASMKAMLAVDNQAASSSSHWSVRLKDILLRRMRGMRDARKARA